MKLPKTGTQSYGNIDSYPFMECFIFLNNSLIFESNQLTDNLGIQNYRVSISEIKNYTKNLY